MTILIACGLQREAKILAGPGIITVPGGGDPAGLEAALEAALMPRAKDVHLVLSCGIGGALDPALGVADTVIDAPVGTPLRAALLEQMPGARPGTIIGRDQITATASQKAALFAATGALAVDMETHIAASVAARHGLAFAAVRAISDTAAETLPPAALVGMNPDGSMALGKVLLSLARRPTQLPALIRTGRSAEAAFRALRRVANAIATLG